LRWTQEVCPAVAATPGASVSAEVAGGVLTLTETLSPWMCGSATLPTFPLKIYQSPVSGDFEVTVTFENLVAAAYGAGVHAYIYDVSNAKTFADASLVGSGSSFELKASLTINDALQDDAVATSSTSGTFTFKRLGGLVTVMAAAGTDKRNISGLLGKNDLRVGIAIQGPFNTPDPAASSSVRILDFAITAGGGKVTADPFDCNSIY
jgi:hypothetical protein